jgi:hypothetical protein
MLVGAGGNAGNQSAIKVRFSCCCTRRRRLLTTLPGWLCHELRQLATAPCYFVGFCNSDSGCNQTLAMLVFLVICQVARGQQRGRGIVAAAITTTVHMAIKSYVAAAVAWPPCADHSRPCDRQDSEHTSCDTTQPDATGVGWCAVRHRPVCRRLCACVHYQW